MDQTIRTLEIMGAGQPGDFQAHSDPKVKAWYNQSTRKLAAKVNFILGKENRGAQELTELLKFRNFVCHNPISLLGMSNDGYKPAFIHRILLRSAMPGLERMRIRMMFVRSPPGQFGNTVEQPI